MNVRINLTLLFLIICQYRCEPIVTSISTDINVLNKNKYGSLLGGTLLYITGSGFDLDPMMNSVMINNKSCKMDGASPNFISCFTPQNEEGQYEVIINVKNEKALCSICQFSYQLVYTPIINQVIPRAQGAAELIQFYGVFKVKNADFFDTFRLVGQSQTFFCDRFEFERVIEIPNQWSKDMPIGCRISPDIQAGYYNISLTTIYGDSLLKESTAYSWDHGQQKAFQFKLVPTIQSLNSNEGSSQGQILTIVGKGFTDYKDQINVQVDGINCDVLFASYQYVVCQVKAGIPTDQQIYVGGSGVAYEFLSTNSHLSIDNLESYFSNRTSNDQIQSIVNYTLTELETLDIDPDVEYKYANIVLPADYYAQQFTGWYKPPIDGNYQFFASCDDYCRVYLGTQNMTTESPTKIIDVTSWKSFRNIQWSGSQSQEIPLLANNYYYIKVLHSQGTGGNHVTVHVKTPIQNTKPIFTIPQIDRWTFYENGINEILSFKVIGGTPKQGYYKLYYNQIYTDKLYLNESASTIETQIKILGLQSKVQIKYINSTGGYEYFNQNTNTTETITDISNSGGIEYEIRFLVYRNLQDLPYVFNRLTGNPTTSITRIQNGTQTAKGNITLSCNGKTTSFNISHEESVLKYQLVNGLNFSNQIAISKEKINSDVQFTVVYNNMHGIQPQIDWDISNMNYDSLTTPNVTTLVLRAGNLNEYYQGIPVEQLYTAHQKPQIVMTIGGIKATCPLFNCDYSVDDVKTPVLLSYTIQSYTMTLNFQNDAVHYVFTKEQLKITLGLFECTVQTFTLSTVDCQFEQNSDGTPKLEAGSYKPSVHIDTFGFVKLDASIQDYTVPLVLTSFSPLSSASSGGTQVTVVGSGFYHLRQNLMKVKIGSVTISKVIVHGNTQISFELPSQTLSGSGEITVQAGDFEQTFQTPISYDNENVAHITSMNINNASPVQKTDLIITGTKFGTNRDNLRVYLDNSTHLGLYELSIYQLSDTEMTVILGGGKVGNYLVRILKIDEGSSVVDTEGANVFSYLLAITSVTPNFGSIYGGTLVNITGINFSPVINQNQAYVGLDRFLSCKIVSATSSTLQCLTVAISTFTYAKELPDHFPNQPQFLDVSQRIQEIAVCQDQSSFCLFTYRTDHSPELSETGNQDVKFDDTITLTITSDQQLQSPQKVTLTSSRQSETVLAEISDIQGTTYKIQFKVPSLQSGVYNVQIRDFILGDSKSTLTLTLYPKILSVFPSESAAGGNIMKIIGSGFTQNTRVSSGNNVTCVKESWTPTEIICITQFQSNDTTATFQIYDFDQDFQCNTCIVTLNQVQPTVSSLTKTSNSVTHTFQIIGSDLDSLLYGRLHQYSCESCQQNELLYNATIISNNATFIEINFQNIAAGQNYTLNLIYQNGKLAKFSTSSNQLVQITAIATVSTTIQSSYAGGARLTITGANFYDGNDLSVNEVYICGKTPQYKCSIVSQTASEIVCETPQLQTIQSAIRYEVSQPQTMDYEASGSKSEFNRNVTYDKDMSTFYWHNDRNQKCFLQADLGEEFVAKIHSIKFIPFENVNPINLEGSQWQAYNEASSSWDVLTTIGKDQTSTGYNIWYNDENDSRTYRKIRYYEPIYKDTNCKIAELEIIGHKYYKTSQDISSVPCNAYVRVNGIDNNIITINNAVIYSDAATPLVTSITPQRGTAAGGTQITIQGQLFDETQTQVIIDNVPCTISSATTTQIICTTGPRPTFIRPSFKLTVNNNIAVNGNNKYLYADLWSSPLTWGGESPPREGDTVHIPAGQNVILDVSTPVLKLVNVEGQLIFDRTQNITLDAYFITVLDGGYLQIGTPEEPFLNKVQITLHGKHSEKQLPMVGNKVIYVKNSRIDIHGKPRIITWTLLESTVQAGESQIILMEAVDWEAGEQIVIASSDYDMNQAEVKEILSVSVDKKTIIVTTPFKFLHYSADETYGSSIFPMRCEVGLLTRNVVIRGSEDSLENQYGGHMMMMGSETDGTIGRISYAEFYHVGQGNIVGRYPIHYHKCGDVPSSFVKGNSVHHSFARLVTLHGIRYLKVSYNVGYDIFGHNYFIEDGSEFKNVLEYNLGMNTKQIWTLVNTDVTAATYWVTHPDNIIRHNRAAGGEFYGFWYQLRKNPIGPTATPDICPDHIPLAEFNNNYAHSYRKFGLRILKQVPTNNPCMPAYNGNAVDPWQSNRHVYTTYENFYSWKNLEKSILAEHVGNVIFKNIMTADNMHAGIDVQRSDEANMAYIDGAVVVGRSYGNPGNSTMYKESHGVMTSKTDRFHVKNVTFYNFGNTQHPKFTAIFVCSQCDNVCQRRPDPATTLFSQISFVNVTQKLFWNGQRRDILHDIDGSLTQTGQEKWITPYYPHIVNRDCYRDLNSTYGDAVICNNNVQLRKISFYNVLPSQKQKMSGNVFDLQNTTLSVSNWTQLPKDKHTLQPLIKFEDGIAESWSYAFATGNSYNLHIEQGENWDRMYVKPSDLFEPDDFPIIMNFNVSQVSETYDAKLQRGGLWSALNNTKQFLSTGDSDTWFDKSNLTIKNSAFKSGDFSYFNYSKMIQLAIAGDKNGTISLERIQCREWCPPPPLILPNDGIFYSWSNASIWPDNVLPQEGDDVIITSSMSVLLDIDPPLLNSLTIDGNLAFSSNVKATTLQANNIWVRHGNMTAGTPTEPFRNKINITLHGQKNSPFLLAEKGITASNKVLYNSGRMYLYGVIPNTTQTKLTQQANPGDTTIEVADSIGWNVGDQISIGATELNVKEFEIRQISSISDKTITLTTALSFFHYGSTTLVETSQGNVDMSAIVIHLTRNIVINPSKKENWGCRILTSKFTNTNTNTVHSGQTILKGVEIAGCGQENQNFASLDFLQGAAGSTIDGCSIHNSDSFGVNIGQTNNVTVQNTVLSDLIKYGFSVKSSSSNIVIQNNVVIGVKILASITQKDSTAGFDFFEAKYSEITLKNNKAIGIEGSGFMIVGFNCDNVANKATWLAKNNGNIAQSCQLGFMPMFGSRSCYGISGLTAMKCESGVQHFFINTEVIADDFRLIENQQGFAIFSNGPQNVHTMKYENISIVAQARNDCPTCYDNQSKCSNMHAIMIPTNVQQDGDIPTPKRNPSSLVTLCTEPPFDNKVFAKNIQMVNYKLSNGSGDFALCNNNLNLRPMSYPWVGRGIDNVCSFNLNNVRVIGSDDNSFVKWAQGTSKTMDWIGGCGRIQCTGMRNQLLTDWSGSLFGKGTPSQIIPRGDPINSDDCTEKPEMDSWLCPGTKYAILKFDHVGTDKRNQVILPVNITSDSWINNINMLWEWEWDGSNEPKDERLIRFFSLIKMNKYYHIGWPTNVPKSMRFAITADQPDGDTGINKDDYIIVNYRYEVPNSIEVRFENGTVIPPQILSKNINLSQHKDKCGIHNYYNNNHTIEFLLNRQKDCVLIFRAISVVQVSLRLDTTEDQFFQNDGQKNFIDTMATFLGISFDRIKITNIRTGSLIIDFQVTSSQQSDQTPVATNQQELSAIQTQLSSGFQDNSIAQLLNVPVLDIQQSIVVVPPVVLSSKNDDDNQNQNTTIIVILVVLSAVIALSLIASKYISKTNKVKNVQAKFEINPDKSVKQLKGDEDHPHNSYNEIERKQLSNNNSLIDLEKATQLRGNRIILPPIQKTETLVNQKLTFFFDINDQAFKMIDSNKKQEDSDSEIMGSEDLNDDHETIQNINVNIRK